MRNDLFNQTLLKKYSKNFKLTPSKHDLIKDYLSKLDSGVFKSETKNYLQFYDIILKGLLEYPGENVLFDEKEDTGTGKSEFVLQSDDKKFMIIELKGQGIDLDKKQSSRSDTKSPVEQAFGYAINTGDVEWIMVSNYDEFRLYNYHEKTKYISFNAEELLDKDKFSYFMATFSYKSHVQSGYVQKIHEGTLLVDRKLASEFYKLYNETRLMLIKELETNSGCERLDAIHYAQLILNRYMFVCFAEDTGLLPSQVSVDTIATPIQKGNLRHNSIWQRLNELFLDINEGNEFKKISAYNGGLFQEDLYFLKIRDIVDDQSIFQDTYQDWKFETYEKDIEHLLRDVGNRVNPVYRNMLTISSFDFSSELDVNILGHIFENSIGDIEELKEDTKSRRKKEGIFYTPDYITDYICRNTIIPYLSKSGKIYNVADLLEEYSWSNDIEDLDEKLKDIKIVDPACGSGAFLNKATDILLEIHEGIFDIKKGYTTTTDMRVGKGKRRRTESIQHTDLGAYVFDHIEKRREILLNNIYGVDLNEESVEITKLSLFLKVCRKNLKLPNLDKNIKCGNSLISENINKEDKAFKWNDIRNFKFILDNGGFDIVIGNPPYVFGGNQGISKEEKTYFKNNYISGSLKTNLFTLFIERGLELLKDPGFLSFIVPNTLLRVTSYKNLREFLVKNSTIKEIVDLDIGVFEKVTASTIIITINKESSNLQNTISIKKDLSTNPYNTIKQDELCNDGYLFNIFCLPKERAIIKKLKINSINLGAITQYIRFGVVITKNKDEVVSYNKLSDDWKPFLEGNEISRYNLNYSGRYLLYKKDLLHRSRTSDLFESNKIMIQRITGGKSPIKATFDSKNFYNKESIINVVLLDEYDYCYNFILGLLNSKLINWFYNKEFSNESKLTVNLSKEYLSQIPIPITSNREKLGFKADEMTKMHQTLKEEMDGFNRWLQKEFRVEKLSKNLEKYYELSEDEFIDELKKKKVDTKSRKNREYLEREFTESLAIIKPLLQEIEETNNKIDQMVYELYNLTEEEIKIIKNNL